jgi:diacylglycerol kinase family enzyme
MLPRAFPGEHIKDIAVTMYKGKCVEIATAKASQLWIDGEVVGTTPAKFTLMPGAMKMMLPLSASLDINRINESADDNLNIS